ncbi:putative secreted protein (Por secretion system target) [Aquimarina sp. MAR_2010_214]|uniref:GEVED domain-containing protein n=1 Tax=Aquimarina sp. MAR_2010_214 TaxID=1250026 RepID=UPI000C70BAE7|nr:GEVED domain-containing protein [Aquimarina sp. MAR_2010_214]PKV49140.1 putative secreted protein (Por secretion system target) [Aquimarina sp. MAR_2010_214]
MKNAILLLVIALCSSITAYSQIGQGGEPLFSNENVSKSSQIPSVTLPKLDIAKLLKEDEQESSKDVPMRFAYPHKTNLNPKNSGKWYTNSKGDRYWLIEIESKGAKSLNLTFSEFDLPEGAKLFVYNKDKSDVRGAFTSANNKSSKRLGLAPVKGDKIIVEYFQPAQVKQQPDLNISTIAHDYKGIMSMAKAFGSSGSCNNNVICAEGDPWRDQIRSVALVILGNGTRWCSGSLINNTANNGTPYFLTANHCTSNQTVTNWVFVFNYESPGCTNNSDGSTSQSISGSQMMDSGSSSDYALLKLSSTPPSSYDVYYSGWDATGSIPTKTTGIHHPAGDVKKISFDNDAPTITGYSGGSGSGTTHWRVLDWDDGTTEGGSSGSALFDQNKRIVGQLHGGGAACGNNSSDWYGRLSVTYPNICQWLAPGCTTKTVDGYNPGNGGGDTQAPSTPAGLSASNVAATSVSLSWTASTDNVGVTGYDVYQGNSIATSVTGASANIAGLTANTAYQFRVKAKDAAGNTSGFSNTVNVTTTGGGGVTYCSANGNNSSEEYISRVQLGSIDKTSTAGSGGYSDFTSESTNLSKGSSNTVTVTPTWTDRKYSEGYRVWIDYNQDGDFTDSGEQVFTQSANQNASVSGSFTVPSSATNGTTRMRVAMRYNTEPSPCGSFNYGEVEDYTVVIGGSRLATKKNNNVAIYPNPAKDILNISFSTQSKEISYSVIDILGKTIISISGENKSTIDVGGLKKGIYFLKFTDGNNQYTKRFVKQ